MKKFYTLFLVLTGLTVLAQAPTTVNYQGVARNTNGTPIVGTIGVSITIHVGSATGTPTLTETYTRSTNQFGIFDVQIGSNTVGGLGNINWGANKYWLGVAIDPQGGSSYGPEISVQQFISVPYALYAEKAGSTGPGGSLTASPNVTVTTSGTNSFNINVPNYVAGNNVTITPLSGNNYQISTGGTSTMTPGGPWVSIPGSVHLANNSDNVGIGAAPSFAKLDVMATTTTGVFVAGPFNGVMAVTTSNSPTNSAIYGNNQGGNTSGPGVTGVSSSSNAAGVTGLNSGPGPGVYGIHQTNVNSPTGHGVYGETNSSSPTAAGVIGVNNGPGPGVYGYQGLATGGPGVWGIGNSTSAAAIHGIHNNGYASVFGDNGVSSNSSSAYGVWGRTNATNSLVSAVHGQNMGAGHGVHGLATANTFSTYGVLGRSIGFGGGVHGEANSTSVLVAGTSGANSGVGVALKGTLPSGSVAGSANAALLIENGHIWATSVNSPSLSNVNNLSAGGTVNGASLVPGSNDVRGMVTLTLQSSTAPWGAGGYIEVSLNFNKPYVAAGGGPWVVMTKYDNSNMIYEIVNITQTTVVFRLKNPSISASTSPAQAVLKFNYMVMQ